MSRVLTGGAVFLVMIFMACHLAAAATLSIAGEEYKVISTVSPTPVTPKTSTVHFPWSGSATLYFIENDTGTITPVTGAQITLNQAEASTGEPQNFYYGTITTTLPNGSSTPVSIAISVVVGPDNAKDWHITGASPLLFAEGWFSQPLSTSTSKRGQMFSIRGAVQDSSTYSFQGVFSSN